MKIHVILMAVLVLAMLGVPACSCRFTGIFQFRGCIVFAKC